MQDSKKTKAQLIAELEALRCRRMEEERLESQLQEAASKELPLSNRILLDQIQDAVIQTGMDGILKCDGQD